MRLRQKWAIPFSFLPTFHPILTCYVLLFSSTTFKRLKPDFKTNHYFCAGLRGHLSKPVEIKQVVITARLCFPLLALIKVTLIYAGGLVEATANSWLTVLGCGAGGLGNPTASRKAVSPRRRAMPPVGFPEHNTVLGWVANSGWPV